MLNFVRCRVKKKKVIIFMKHFLQEIITSLGLLVNSANDIYKNIYFFCAKTLFFFFNLGHMLIPGRNSLQKPRYLSLCLFILDHPF